jgi:nucleoid-associated protein YgaU
MINSTSRYENGSFGKVVDPRSLEETTYVNRRYTVNSPVQYWKYTFKDGDRLDIMASMLFGDSTRWHNIMDINPSIDDPFAIKPGTVLRIPRV